MKFLLLMLALPVSAATVTIQKPDGSASCEYESFSGTSTSITYQCKKTTTPPTDPTQPPSGCVPTGRAFTLPAPGVQLINNMLPPNVPGYAKLGAYTSGSVAVFQAVGTPQGTTLDVWYSECPGVKDATVNQTYTNAYGLGSYKPCATTMQYNGGPIDFGPVGNMNTCALPKGKTWYFNYKVLNCSLASCPNNLSVNVTAP